MATGVTTKFENNLDLILKATDEQREMALTAVGMTAESYAKKRCPVDTGRLRNSITYAITSNKGKDGYSDNQGASYSGGSARGTPEEDAVYIGTNVEYAQLVENGTSERRAKHFLKSACMNHTEEYKKLIEDAFGNADES